MPRRDRPTETQRSEHWLRVAVNERTDALNARICTQFNWGKDEQIEWLSPVTNDAYAEYYDDAFLELLGADRLRVPLREFWPAGGPRWDGLARTASGKIILVEAKAYIEEAVDFQTSALGESLERIMLSLDEAKRAFGARSEAHWEGAARLAKKCLGLGDHPFSRQIGTVIWSVPMMVADQSPV